MDEKIDLKSKLLEIEENFNKIKNKIEKFYFVFLFIYFIPPIFTIFLLDKNYLKNNNLLIKIAIIILMLIGLIIHFYIRNKYFRGKKRFKSFIEKNLNNLKKDFENEDLFSEAIIEAAKKIFISRDMELTNVTINQSLFWHLVFYYLEIELTD